MSAYYESKRQQNKAIAVQRRRCLGFPAHFHNNVEIYLLRRGSRDVYLNGTKYAVTDGTVVFFDSYDIHGYGEAKELNDDCVVIIPYDYLERFNHVRNNLKSAKPVVYNQELCLTLMEIADKLLTTTEDEYFLSSSVDLFLSYINRSFLFSLSSDNNNNELIRGVLAFIDQNYLTQINLSKLAKSLGYTKEHLSRTFHKYFNMGIPQYINDLRIKHFYALLSLDKNKNLTQLIYECGFNSIQSFYRNKARFDKNKR